MVHIIFFVIYISFLAMLTADHIKENNYLGVRNDK